MRRQRTTRLWAVVLPFVLALALVACNDQEVEEDPRTALRDAVMAFRDYEGIELVIGAQLDEAAQRSALEDGDFSEDELALLTDSTLTVRGVEGEDEDDGQSEFVLVVGDETVLTIRALADYELYTLIDLPAIERVAESLDAGADFQQGISEFEQMAGFFGLGQVASAAREAEWIRVAGLQQMVEMAEQQDPEEQPDEADLEALAREVGERLLDFLEDDDVQVAHVGSEDAGERVRVTAAGAQLRGLAVDLIEAIDDVAGVADPTGMGMGTAELRAELEDAIGDDLQVSFDAWIDGGELSQVAVDVFELARLAEAPDVPDGEFLIAIGIADFAGPVEAPDAEVTFDVFEIFGAMMGELGDLGEDPFAEDDLEEAPDDPLGEEGDLGAEDDFCLTEEEVEQFLEGLPEEQQDLDRDELEEMLGIPIC